MRDRSSAGWINRSKLKSAFTARDFRGFRYTPVFLAIEPGRSLIRTVELARSHVTYDHCPIIQVETIVPVLSAKDFDSRPLMNDLELLKYVLAHQKLITCSGSVRH